MQQHWQRINFTHVTSIHANLLEQKKAYTQEKSPHSSYSIENATPLYI